MAVHFKVELSQTDNFYTQLADVEILLRDNILVNKENLYKERLEGKYSEAFLKLSKMKQMIRFK